MGFFGNLMNNYYYGKAGKGDYTVSDMPANRFQLFGAVMRVRWSSLIWVNLLYMVFWFPCFYWTVRNVSYMLSNPADFFSLENFASYMTAFTVGLVPCIAITGPFTAGISFVLRNWARDEHSFVWSDFWDAVKNNWKQALLVSIISSLIPMLTFMSWLYYGQMSSSNILFIAPLTLTLIVAIVWKLAEMVIYTLMVTYKLSFGALVRNAILLTIAKLPKSIGMKLLTWLIPGIAVALIWFIPSITIQTFLVTVVLYIVYVPGFNRLMQASYANALCERYLNTQIEGARTNIGLRPENWDDTEYIPQDDEE